MVKDGFDRLASGIAGVSQKLGENVIATEKAGEAFSKLFTNMTTSIVSGQFLLDFLKEVKAELIDFAKETVKAASDFELANARLTGALRATGLGVQGAAVEYRNLAETISETTTVSRTSALDMEARFVSLANVSAEEMPKATQAALDLSAALGVDLDRATTMISKALDGNVTGLKKFGIQLDASRVQAEGASYIFGVLNDKFAGQAEMRMQTFAGQVEHLGNVWEELQIAMGKTVTNDPLIWQALRHITSALEDLDKKGQDVSTTFTEKLAKAIDKVLAPSQMLAPGLARKLPGMFHPAENLVAGMAEGALEEQTAAQVSAMTAKIKEFGEAAGGTGITVKDVLNRALEQTQDDAKYLTDTIKEGRAEWEKHQKAVEAHRDAILGDSKGIKDEIAALDQMARAGTDDEDVKKRMLEAIVKLELKTITLTGAIYKWQEAQKQVLDNTVIGVTAIDRYSAAMDYAAKTGVSMADAMARISRDVQGLGMVLPTARFSDFHSELTGVDDATGNLTTISIPNMGIALGTLGSDMQFSAEKTKEYRAELKALGQEQSFAAIITSNLDQSLKNLPRIMELAFTGGGGAQGAVKAIGTDVGAGLGKSISTEFGKSITNTLGDTLGGVVKDMLPGIGGLVGAGLSALFKLGGPSQEELQGRGVEKKFEDSFGGFAAMMAKVGEAYMATGRSAQQAQADVAALMNAEKQGGTAVQTMIDRINGAFTEQKVRAAEVSTSVNGILSAAQTVGVSFPDALKPMVEKLASLPGLTDAEKNSLLGLTGAVIPNFDQLTKTAATYGLTLEDLGPQFEQANISSRADVIFKDFTNLTKAGADYGGVLNHFGKSVADLVDDAVKYGSALPTALQPIVEKMATAGVLTDSTGKKITDLSKLKFDDAGDPLAKGMDKLTDAINHLGDLLSPTGLPAIASKAADAIGNALGSIKSPDITLNAHWSIPSLPREEDLPHAAAGIFATGSRGVATWFGEGGEPELGGPVSFMADVLRQAMNETGRGGRSGESDMNVVLVEAMQGIRRDLRNIPRQMRDAFQQLG